MAISLVGTASGSKPNGDNVTITLPSGLAQNDLVCVFGGHPRAGTNAGVSTSGYTEDLDHSSGSVRASFSWKFMGASPDTSVTCIGTGEGDDATVYVVMAFRGVDTGDPIDAATTSAYIAGGSSSSPNSPSITTVSDGAAVISFALAETDNAVATSPSGYLSQIYVSRSETDDCSCGGAYKIKTTAGSENPSAWGGWSSSDWVAFTVALKPQVEGSFGNGALSGGSIRGTASFRGGVVPSTVTANIAFTGTADVSFKGNSIGNVPAAFDMTATATVGFEVIGGFEGNIELTHTFNVAWVGNKELMSAVRDVIEERGFMRVTVD